MDSFCVICEEKCKDDQLSDLADFATVFYNLTSFQISERKDKHSLKICILCKEKLLHCNVFRELCMKACTKLTQHVSLSLVKLENNSDGELHLDDDSFHESQSTVYCNLENPSSISGTIEGSFSTEQTFGDEANNKTVEAENDPFAHQQKRTRKNPLECHLCGKKFLSSIRFEGHIRTHEGLKPAQCKICGKEFSTYRNHKMHMLHKHTDIPRATFSCDFQDCKSMFVTKEGLIVHRKRHDPEYTASVVCETCGKKFSSKGALKKHSYIHTGNMPFHCEVCNKGYPTAYKLKQHTSRQKCTPIDQAESETIVELVCQLCGKRFRNPIRFEGHLRTHQGLKPCLCKLCGKEFIMFRTLKMHMLHKHTDIPRKKFPCDFEGCKSLFATKQGLVNHQKRHDPAYTTPEPKTVVCETCGKTFSTNSDLKKHSYIHTGNMPFHCAVCNKRYPTSYKLKEHTMRHQGIKNHTCPHCGLKKTTMYELKVHMNYHTKDKQFSCEFCEHVFLNQGNLKRHIRIVHRQIISYNCTHCNQSFGKAETLKNHIMTHTGEKPHACTVCGKRFIQLVALRRHAKVHVKHERRKMNRISCTE